MVSVDYTNHGYLRPNLPMTPAVKPVTYSYRPFFMPQQKNVKFNVRHSPTDKTKRSVDATYGLTIRLEFQGTLVKFTWKELLTALTTGLVLVTSASTIVLYLAL